ncbi:MAG: pseudouridine synthase [archaeon]
MDKQERVQKLIAQSGWCSRRKAEEFIAEGRVTVNGHAIKLGDKATPQDNILVDGRKVVLEKKVTIMLNKPKHYISAMSDQFYNKTLSKLLPVEERIFHIGRLDKDARGMLLLTNDGDLANRIMHPRYQITKTYIAQLDGVFTKQHKEILERGIRLKDGFVKARIRQLEKNLIELTLAEGKHKIVKRAFQYFGFRVVDLKRTKIGQLSIDVKERGYRTLTGQDIKKIFA